MSVERVFPKRLFRKWFFSQLILSSFILFATAALVYFSNENVFIFLAGAFVVLGIMNVFWFQSYLLQPLARVLGRVNEMSSKEADAQTALLDDSDIEEPGEWSDLDLELNRLRKVILDQKKRYTRGATEIDALMSAISSGILAVDRDYTLLFCNDVIRSLFHRTWDIASDARLTEVVRRPDVIEAYTRSIEKGESIHVQTWLTADSPKYYSISVAPLREEKTSRIYGAVGVFHDITEIKKSEQIRVEFVANASHELRTPLTSAKGFMQTLMEDWKGGHTDDVERCLQTVSQNLDRLANLVNDLLNLSSLDSGVKLQKEKINVKEFTSGLLGRFGSFFQSKRQQVASQFNVEFVIADVKQLEQVLGNLLENAHKYVQEGGRIEISWSSAPGGINLKVSDNGPGISDEHLPRIFERFYRVDQMRSREMGGTGLGLSIVKHAVMAHSGKVNVSSQIGRGTEFTCFFPYPNE